MASIMDAIDQARLSLPVPMSPSSTQASPSHSKANRVHHLVSNTEDAENQDPNQTKGRISSSATRVATPHPSRTSASRALRVSSSVHNSFTTPLSHSDTTRDSGKSIYNTPITQVDVELDHAHPEFSPDYEAHAGDRSVSPSTLVRPGNPLENTLTTPSIHMSGMTSQSTPGEDLMLGPQSIPFALKRRPEIVSEDVSSLRAEVPVFTPRFRTRAAPAVVIKPAKDEEEVKPTVDKPAKLTHKAVEDRLCSWRRDQLKQMKPAWIRSGTTARPIPTLYGPLSLPYARNPSGIDATVADDTAYLSHVFGLRSAPDVPLPGVAHAARSVSGGTQSTRSTSGSHTTRSTSGSSTSFLLSTTNSSHNTSIVTEGSSYTSVGGTHHSRPMVMRDPNQHIGIRNKMFVGKGKEGDVRTGEEAARPQTDNKENEAPILGLIPVAHEAETAIATTYPISAHSANAMTHSLRPRAHSIGNLSTLTPIPGSPVEEQVGENPFLPLYQEALDAAQTPAEVARPRSASFSSAGRALRQRVDDYTGSLGGPVRVPAGFMPVLFNPETMTYEVIGPFSPFHPDYDAANTFPPAPPVTPQTSGASHASPSKADASANWRTKRDASWIAPKRKDSFSYPEAPSTMAHLEKGGDDSATGTGSGSEVMTMESLFEKFSGTPPKAVDDVVKINPPVTATHTHRKKAVIKPSKSTPVSPRRSSITVLGETSKHSNKDTSSPTQEKSKSTPDSPKSAPSTARRIVNNVPATKGTPGAGKLLKKPSSMTVSDDEGSVPARPKSATSKSKGRVGKKSVSAQV